MLVLNPLTASGVELLPSNSAAPAHFDFSLQDKLPHTGAADEFDIDEYIEEQDVSTQAAIATAGSWVADVAYPEILTLATLRLRAGLSQKEFGVRCELAQPHVSRYECGAHEPSLSLAVRMAKVLGVSVDVFAEAFRQTVEAHRQK